MTTSTVSTPVSTQDTAQAAQAAHDTAQAAHDTAQAAPARVTAQSLLGRYVLIRDHKAGVHVGTLTELDMANKIATLTGARKIWAWEGAMTVHSIATHGLDQQKSKISSVVDVVVSFDLVEIVACTDVGMQSVAMAPVWTV